MIDVTKLVSEYNRADLQSYVNAFTPADLAFRTFFPTQYTPTLTFESLQADFGAMVAADVVAFDSRSPRKGRQLPKKVTGDIPKIEIARVKKESDLNTYRQLQAALGRVVNQQAFDQISDQLVEWVYGDSKFVLNGVNSRAEWMAKRIASTGKLKLTIANNEGGLTTFADIDFGIPAGNIFTTTIDWDTVATATPIADIRNRVNLGRTKGINLRYAITDQATFDRFALVDSVQKFSAGFAQNALSIRQQPSLENVNAAMASAGLPQFIIWDSYVNLESKAGVYTATTGWEDGVITLSPTILLGGTQWTTTADDFVDFDDSVKANNDFVTVKAFAEQDPITVVTKGIAYATPVLANASSLYQVKTQI